MAYTENPELRLEHPDNLVNHETKIMPGRREGDTEIPEWLRATIGAAARLSGSRKAAEVFGVSQPTANTASKGLRSPNGEVDPDLKAKVEGKVADARDYAATSILKALEILPDKIDSNMKAKDLAEVSKSLSVVIERLAPLEDKQKLAAQQVVFMVPAARKLDSYDIIEVKAEVVDDEKD